jgi:hypothetical protein
MCNENLYFGSFLMQGHIFNVKKLLESSSENVDINNNNSLRTKSCNCQYSNLSSVLKKHILAHYNKGFWK